MATRNCACVKGKRPMDASEGPEEVKSSMGDQFTLQSKRPINSTAASVLNDRNKRQRGINSEVSSLPRLGKHQYGSQASVMQMPLRPISAPLQWSGQMQYCRTGLQVVVAQNVLPSPTMVVPPLHTSVSLQMQWQAAQIVMMRQRKMPPMIPSDLIPAYLAQISAMGSSSVRPSTGAASEIQNINFSEETTSIPDIVNGVNLGSTIVPAALQILPSRQPVAFSEHQPHFQRPQNHALASSALLRDIQTLGTPTRSRVITEHRFFPEHPGISSPRFAVKHAGCDEAEIPNESSGLNSGHQCFFRSPRLISERYADQGQPPHNSFSVSPTSAQMRSNFHPSTSRQSQIAQIKNASVNQFCIPITRLGTISPHVQSDSENQLEKPNLNWLYRYDGKYIDEKVSRESPIHVSYNANCMTTLDSQPVSPTRHAFKSVNMLLNAQRSQAQFEEQRVKSDDECKDRCQRKTEADENRARNQQELYMSTNPEICEGLQLAQIEETHLSENLSQNQTAECEEEVGSSKEAQSSRGNTEVMQESENPEGATVSKFQPK